MRDLLVEGFAIDSPETRRSHQLFSTPSKTAYSSKYGDYISCFDYTIYRAPLETETIQKILCGDVNYQHRDHRRNEPFLGAYYKPKEDPGFNKNFEEPALTFRFFADSRYKIHDCVALPSHGVMSSRYTYYKANDRRKKDPALIQWSRLIQEQSFLWAQTPDDINMEMVVGKTSQLCQLAAKHLSVKNGILGILASISNKNGVEHFEYMSTTNAPTSDTLSDQPTTFMPITNPAKPAALTNMALVHSFFLTNKNALSVEQSLLLAATYSAPRT